MDVAPDPGFLLMSGNTGNYGTYKSTQMDNLFKALRKAMDQAAAGNFENAQAALSNVLASEEVRRLLKEMGGGMGG